MRDIEGKQSNFHLITLKGEHVETIVMRMDRLLKRMQEVMQNLPHDPMTMPSSTRQNKNNHSIMVFISKCMVN